MANVNATVRRVAHGFNDWNHRFIHASNGNVPNGDTLTVDLSEYSEEAPATQPMAPFFVRIDSVGAGDVGARVRTPAPSTVTWTYDEATGLLVITNGSGGGLSLNVFIGVAPINA